MISFHSPPANSNPSKERLIEIVADPMTPTPLLRSALAELSRQIEEDEQQDPEPFDGLS